MKNNTLTKIIVPALALFAILAARTFIDSPANLNNYVAENDSIYKYNALENKTIFPASRAAS
ncbi:MAG: hypothetical protein WDN09_02585 [bacterium]